MQPTRVNIKSFQCAPSACTFCCGLFSSVVSSGAGVSFVWAVPLAALQMIMITLLFFIFFNMVVGGACLMKWAQETRTPSKETKVN